MATHRRKPDWGRVLARLRRGVAAGDVASITELGVTLTEGIQDRNGRCLVRRNPAYSVRLFRRAAQAGDLTATGSLGYAYDVGLGVRGNKSLAIKWYRRAARLGSSTAVSNLATVYRDRGELKRAHQWWRRAAEMGDGDAAVSAGYDFYYGIGARRDVRSARRLLRQALRAGKASPAGREEALYHLAVTHVDAGVSHRASRLLKLANCDGDYPEAAALLGQIKARAALSPCRCRRDIRKDLLGHTTCPQHPGSVRLGVRDTAL